jgi:hypothetical protein
MPSRTVPAAGSIPAVAGQNTKPPATIAWLYGLSAAGSWSLTADFRIVSSHLS